MKWNTLLYSLLFSGLGIFSFLLLANYTNLTPQVTNTIHTPGAFVFVVATFNILGYCTLRISSWMNRLYSNNLRWKWKFIAVYIGVMLLFLLLNYGLLVAAKLMGRAENPFTFQIGGIRILLVGGACNPGIIACQPLHKEYPPAATKSSATTERE